MNLLRNSEVRYSHFIFPTVSSQFLAFRARSTNAISATNLFFKMFGYHSIPYLELLMSHYGSQIRAINSSSYFILGLLNISMNQSQNLLSKTLNYIPSSCSYLSLIFFLFAFLLTSYSWADVHDFICMLLQGPNNEKSQASKCCTLYGSYHSSSKSFYRYGVPSQVC